MKNLLLIPFPVMKGNQAADKPVKNNKQIWPAAAKNTIQERENKNTGSIPSRKAIPIFGEMWFI